MLRVSDRMMSANLIYRLTKTSEQLFRAQERVASGLRFTRPSQDPAGALRASALRSHLSELNRYLKNCDLASSWLKQTEVAVADVAKALREAKTTAVSGMNDALDDEARGALADKIAQLTQTLMRAGNYHDGDRYLLAGYQLLQPPLQENPSAPPPVVYQGDGGQVEMRVGRDLTVTVNLTADVVFNLGGAAAPDLEDVFSTLERLESALRADDHEEMTAAQAALEKHLARVNALRGEIGARLQRVDFDRGRLTETRDAAKVLLGETEGADMAEAVVELEQQRTAYQATAAACASLMRASLVQYLR